MKEKTPNEIVNELLNAEDVKATRWKPLFGEDYIQSINLISGKKTYQVINPKSNKIMYSIGEISLFNFFLFIFLFGVFGILNYTFVADIYALLSFISLVTFIYCLFIFEY